MNNKRKMIIVCACLVCIVVISLVIYFNNTDDELPIVWKSVRYTVDINEPKEIVDSSDNIFFGYIENQIETVYTNEDVNDGNPMTVYSVVVIQNIKGQLEEGIAVKINKYGGISKDKKYISLETGDEMLQDNEIYLFCTFMPDAGNMSCLYPTSTIKLEDYDDNLDISNIKELKKVVSDSKLFTKYKQLLNE